jgi:hypothetical protein
MVCCIRWLADPTSSWNCLGWLALAVGPDWKEASLRLLDLFFYFTACHWLDHWHRHDTRTPRLATAIELISIGSNREPTRPMFLGNHETTPLWFGTGSLSYWQLAPIKSNHKTNTQATTRRLVWRRISLSRWLGTRNPFVYSNLPVLVASIKPFCHRFGTLDPEVTAETKSDSHWLDHRHHHVLSRFGHLNSDWTIESYKHDPSGLSHWLKVIDPSV